MSARRADFAGTWYPGRESECRSMIEDFLRDSEGCPGHDGHPVGGIVPHAGWVFSGRIACNVISCLRQEEEIDTCIIFGRHLHPSSGRYIMADGAWETPLGSLTIDGDLALPLLEDFAFSVETAKRYEQDNTIELQLPFVKYFFPGSRILPVGVPPTTDSLLIASKVVEIASSLNRKIVVIGSTDLTHYGDNYGFRPKGIGKDALDWVRQENDSRMIQYMTAMDPKGIVTDSLRSRNACCGGAAACAVQAALDLGATRGEKVVYSTSYDVRPDSSFVGYVGILFH